VPSRWHGSVEVSVSKNLRSLLAIGAATALMGVIAPGCVVRVYQPLSGLHDPLVVDPTLPNFHDTQLTLACEPGGDLNDQQAGALCDHVRTLFENQGAVVIERASAELGPASAPADDGPPRTELSMLLRARRAHDTKHPLSWALCIVSLGVLPAVSEKSFAQEVVLRDAHGSLLVTDTLEGRVVERYGVGPWLGNTLLNLTRSPEDRLDKDVANRDLSGDLYGRLSQLAYNARVRARVQDRPPVARAE
jgi:hypothetical protein